MNVTEYTLVTLTKENLDKVQMFCGHSPTYKQGYTAKREWLRQRIDEGMRYTILQVQGNNAGLIEYIPAEYAWRGVEAPGYLFIHCLWVIGRNRKKGHGRVLLEACLKDAQGTNGIAVVTSKSHWLPTPKLFLKNGFEAVDHAEPVFDLLVKRFEPEAALPKFRKPTANIPAGLTLYQSVQCPYFQNTGEAVRRAGEKLHLPVNIIQVDNATEAQATPCLYGTLGYYYEGELLTYHPTGTEELVTMIEPKLAGRTI